MRVVMAMAFKELLVSLRDRRTGVIIFITPIIQLIIFGYVVTTEIKNLPVGYIDMDDSPLSRRIIETLDIQDEFEVKGRFLSLESAENAVKAGKIRLILVVPAGFGSSIKKGGGSLQFVVDGADANATRLLLSKLWPTLRNEVEEVSGETFPRIIMLQNLIKNQISGNNYESDDKYPEVNTPRMGGVNLSTRIYFNPQLKSPLYMVPGVIVLIITIISSVLTAAAVVREREVGTLEQILVSPMRPYEFILGKTVPFALLSLLDVVFIFPLGILLFRLPFRGDPLLLLLGIFLYLLGTLGLGLLVSTISETQQQAMMTTFFVLMPLYLLSGLFFPVRSMPPFFQKIAFLNPLTHFLIITRGILLKGSTLSDLTVPLSYLLIFGVLILFVAVIRFRKEI